jgi:hypothetical protein
MDHRPRFLLRTSIECLVMICAWLFSSERYEDSHLVGLEECDLGVDFDGWFRCWRGLETTRAGQRVWRESGGYFVVIHPRLIAIEILAGSSK